VRWSWNVWHILCIILDTIITLITSAHRKVLEQLRAGPPFPAVFIQLCSSGFLVILLRLVAWLEKIRRKIRVIFSSLKDSELGLSASKPLSFVRYTIYVMSYVCMICFLISTCRQKYMINRSWFLSSFEDEILRNPKETAKCWTWIQYMN
jgi:hypothetical protein